MSRTEHRIDAGAFETLSVAESSTGTRLRYITEAHGEVHLHLDQFVKLVDRSMEALEAEGVLPRHGLNAEPAEYDGCCSVVLRHSGPKKIRVMAALRKIRPDLSLKEVKEMAEGTSATVVSDLPPEMAREVAEQLEAAGADVEIGH